jgi:hypothetical protein
MPLKAYEEFAQEPLAFPVNGKIYVVAPLGYKEGIKLTRVLSGEDKSLEDAPADDVWRLVMGPTYDEMVADNVPIEALSRAGLATLADFNFGREMAEKTWESGLDPKALEAALAAAKAAETRAASKRSPSTASAGKTRKRASSKATTSPKK